MILFCNILYVSAFGIIGASIKLSTCISSFGCSSQKQFPATPRAGKNTWLRGYRHFCFYKFFVTSIFIRRFCLHLCFFDIINMLLFSHCIYLSKRIQAGIYFIDIIIVQDVFLYGIADSIYNLCDIISLNYINIIILFLTCIFFSVHLSENTIIDFVSIDSPRKAFKCLIWDWFCSMGL